MIEKLPMITGVHFEQTPTRLKIVLPIKRHWVYLSLYSALMIIWVGMMVWGLVYSTRILFSEMNRRFVFIIMLLVMLAILYLFGRILRRQWAAYFSNREILFINNEELILRRPVSMWGNTDVYDMQHVTPLYVDELRAMIGFEYGHRQIYLAEGLTGEARNALAGFINEVYFANRSGK